MNTLPLATPDLKESDLKQANILKEKIETQKARIGVLGLGYVGLPLAMEFARAGFAVTGFDVDPRRIQSLSKGRSHVGDIPNQTVASAIEQKRFFPTTNFSRLEAVDVVIVCVPTPLNKTKDPDISYIANATEQIARSLHKQQLIILESTSYPGTTRECMLPRLEAEGLRAGKDFYLAFSPERIDPGNPRFNLTNTPKVVGGLTPACRDLAAKVYEQIIPRVVPVSSLESAEMVKILENTFRAVNIGLANEMALVCDKLNLNVWEIIEAASSKPYGFMPFFPGPGLGGHCIPVDPHYLAWKMKTFNFSTRFIELAGEINSHMPEFVISKISRALNSRKKSMHGSKIVVLGVTYKADVADLRESPALDILELLHEQGAAVEFHDPYVSAVRLSQREMTGKPFSPALLKSADAVVIVTPHKAFDPRQILRYSPLVIDTRNLMGDIQARNLIRL